MWRSRSRQYGLEHHKRTALIRFSPRTQQNLPLHAQCIRYVGVRVQEVRIVAHLICSSSVSSDDGAVAESAAAELSNLIKVVGALPHKQLCTARPLPLGCRLHCISKKRHYIADTAF